MNKLYIIIPAYNEQDTISKVINQWYPIVNKVGNGSRLIVIDDGSKDATYNIIKNEKKKGNGKPFLVVLSKANSGHGATVQFGYNYAIKNNADFIFQTDSDGQTEPNEFWQFWKERNKYDIIIGYRNNRKDGLSRIFVTKMLKFVIYICFKCSVTDANTPFRLMSKKTLEENMKYIPKNFNLHHFTTFFQQLTT